MTAAQTKILAFIEAAQRLAPGDEKTAWVAFLVRQFELRCEATVIKGKK